MLTASAGSNPVSSAIAWRQHMIKRLAPFSLLMQSRTCSAVGPVFVGRAGRFAAHSCKPAAAAPNPVSSANTWRQHMIKRLAPFSLLCKVEPASQSALSLRVGLAGLRLIRASPPPLHRILCPPPLHGVSTWRDVSLFHLLQIKFLICLHQTRLSFVQSLLDIWRNLC